MSIVLIHTLQMSHVYIAGLVTPNTNERYELTADRLLNHEAACELNTVSQIIRTLHKPTDSQIC